MMDMDDELVGSIWQDDGYVDEVVAAYYQHNPRANVLYVCMYLRPIPRPSSSVLNHRI